MNAITTTLILLAGLAAGCVTPSYHGPGPSTSTAPATTTYVYTPTDRATCEAAGGRWHMFSQTCTIPR